MLILIFLGEAAEPSATLWIKLAAEAMTLTPKAKLKLKPLNFRGETPWRTSSPYWIKLKAEAMTLTFGNGLIR